MDWDIQPQELVICLFQIFSVVIFTIQKYLYLLSDMKDFLQKDSLAFVQTITCEAMDTNYKQMTIVKEIKSANPRLEW